VKLESEMKYAVLHSGGKQYVAREGETIEIDRLPLETGETVEFKEILLSVDGSKVKIGKPFIQGAVVKGRVEAQIKGEKIIVFKYIPKERYRRKQGHRQRYTRILIDEINPGTVKRAAASEGEKSKPKSTAKKSGEKAKSTITSTKASTTKKAPSKTAAKSSTTKTTKKTSKSTKKTTSSKSSTSSSKSSSSSTSSKKSGTSSKSTSDK
jgi:large subunit ribosomal protein L21